MRNLKKFLALVLAMMMAFSLMVTANAAILKDYADSSSVESKYATAVDILTPSVSSASTAGPLPMT